jgi:hypothetical protein
MLGIVGSLVSSGLKTVGINVDAKTIEGFVGGGGGSGGILGTLFGGPAALLESVSDTLGLPEWAGDLLSLGTNYFTGNYLGMLDDAVDFLSDLGPPAETEAEVSGGPNGQTNLGAPTSGSHGAPSTCRGSSGAEATRSEGATSAPGGEASRTKAGGGGGKPSEGVASAKEFLGKYRDNEDFMSAIRNGDIPPEVADSPAAMMMIQERMQRIQLMNQLMTGALKARHDMEMAIVRNLPA